VAKISNLIGKSVAELLVSCLRQTRGCLSSTPLQHPSGNVTAAPDQSEVVEEFLCTVYQEVSSYGIHAIFLGGKPFETSIR